jgi:hypothetical protein
MARTRFVEVRALSLKPGSRTAFHIESYTDVVLEIEEPTIAGLRQRPS